MAFESVWYETKLPQELIEVIERDLNSNFNDQLLPGKTIDTNSPQKTIRDSQICWVPEIYWIGGFIMNYVNIANRENFMYDLHHIDQQTMQYTTYKKGEYYGWHCDQDLPTFYKRQASAFNASPGNELLRDFANIGTETVRKLSFSLLLNDDYEGGQFQFLNDSGELYETPKKKGLLVIFDSRTRHRVRPVKSGVRKSIVGWVVGPRWK
jgi:PKHD-type hydroxylase